MKIIFYAKGIVNWFFQWNQTIFTLWGVIILIFVFIIWENVSCRICVYWGHISFFFENESLLKERFVLVVSISHLFLLKNHGHQNYRIIFFVIKFLWYHLEILYVHILYNAERRELLTLREFEYQKCQVIQEFHKRSHAFTCKKEK